MSTEGEIIEAKRSYKLLVDSSNYIYCRAGKYKDTRYWKCLDHKKCPARAHTDVKLDPGKVSVSLCNDKPHTHPSDLSKLDFIRAERAAIKQMEENRCILPRRVMGDTQASLAKLGTALPKTEKAFLQTLTRARSLAGPKLMNPATYNDIAACITPEMRLTSRGDKFLIFFDQVQADAEERIMMFMSPMGREILRQSWIFWADGTFDTCPQPFFQVIKLCWFILFRFMQDSDFYYNSDL